MQSNSSILPLSDQVLDLTIQSAGDCPVAIPLGDNTYWVIDEDENVEQIENISIDTDCEPMKHDSLLPSLESKVDSNEQPVTNSQLESSVTESIESSLSTNEVSEATHEKSEASIETMQQSEDVISQTPPEITTQDENHRLAFQDVSNTNEKGKSCINLLRYYFFKKIILII